MNNGTMTPTTTTDTARQNHEWRFFRAGGFDQVCIDTGADLLALAQLDQKLWVALSCPARGIEFDAQTLALIDADNDGHVRASEIIAAVQWAAALLKDANLLVKGVDEIPLSAIDDTGAEGRYLLAAARRILHNLGKPDAVVISMADTADTGELVLEMRFNGDGVITPAVTGDAALQAVLGDIMACCGTVPDRCGENGVSGEIVAQFFTQAQAYADWWQKAEGNNVIWFLGAGTLAAADAYRVVKAKVDDYFTRCRMAAYDPRAAMPLSRSVEDYQLLAARNLSVGAAEVAAFPLAVTEANKPLPLLEGINPAWMQAIQALRATAVVPLFGEKTSLAVEDWEKLGIKFAALESWAAEKPPATIEQLGIARIRAILDGNYRAAIEDLIAQDKALEAEVNAIAAVDKLLRYCRDLHTLVNNFVSFRNFYTGSGKAVFQFGTLYLDGRSCELCVQVEDINKHAALANLSRVCLAYCECARKGGNEKISIAAAFTAGDSDQLMVGRNGVFYDRKGQDWDATIVRILEHPISIRQAFWSPYKKLSRLISEQLQKFSAAKASAAESKMANAGQAVVETPTAPAKPPFDVAKFAGIFAAIGLAIGAIGGILASIVSGVLGLKFWQIPLALIGLLLLISLPFVALAWFKLKRRNLAPILDANGWAINARARINIPFGTSLTGLAGLPEGANRSLADPFEEELVLWPYYLVIAAGICSLIGLWYVGFF